MISNHSSTLSPAQSAQLIDHLVALDYPTFSRIMQTLLQRSGYAPVLKTDRQHKRGRTHSGGLDIRAYARTDLDSCLTLIQIKQYERVVSRRYVDELRGVLIRYPADKGLLLTTSTFSRVAERAAKESEVAPIQLIDGSMIVNLMTEHRIGITADRRGRLRIDAAFFDNLQEKSRGTGGATPAAQGRRNEASPRRPSGSDSQTDPTLPANRAGNGATGGDMQWRTHVLIGLTSLWLFELLPNGIQREKLPLMLGAAAFGSLLPDLDAAQSKIKHLSAWGIKPFYLPSLAIYRAFGHRGFLHSVSALFFVGLASLPVSIYCGWQTGLALLLGYGAHLAADACTRSGIPFWYVPYIHPIKRRVHLLPPRLRFVTGSEAELALVPLLGLLILILLLRHLPPGEVAPLSGPTHSPALSGSQSSTA